MPKTPFKSVDQYIAAQPKAAQAVLTKVRDIIRKALPKAEEIISYNIPAYKLHGSRVLYFAGFSHHFSLYPISDHVVAVLNVDVAPYKVSKATLRFPLSVPVPAKLIASIAKYRAKEAAQRVKATGAKKR